MVSLEELLEKRIGYIFSEEGIYEPDIIAFTVETGERVEIGDIVAIKHPSKNTIVFYQVIEVPVRRKARDYEEDLVRVGRPLIDDTRNYPRARAKQIGYVEDLDKLLRGESSIDDLMMLIEHIKPLSEVYRPKPEVIDKLLAPREDGIAVGKIYPNWKHTYMFDLKRLLRQGLLVVGGVGTGKTTTMLTMIYRVIKAFLEKGGRPHILIIDKDGEYGTRELIDLVGENNYIRIHIDDIIIQSFNRAEQFAEELLNKLGYFEKRSTAAKTLYAVALEVARKALQSKGTVQMPSLTPAYFEENILPIIKKNHVKVYAEIFQKFNAWKRQFKESQPTTQIYSVNDVLNMLKDYIIVHIDLSAARDFNHAYDVLNNLLLRIYDEALNNPDFGCIVVIDEAHLFAPERGGISLASNDRITSALRDTISLLATTGARNGVTLFVATQRPSLISKTITTQMGQNIIAHRVEDVDLGRIEEIMGPIARRVRVLPRGWAIVKALASKIREPLIVRVEPETFPKSTGRTAYERFLGKP
jgi:DNA helicase HerA-like ATPase